MSQMRFKHIYSFLFHYPAILIAGIFLLVSPGAFSQQQYFYALQGQVVDTIPIPPIQGSNYRAVWGYGQLNAGEITTYGNLGTEAAYKGYHILRDWSEIEISDGVYDWSTLDAAIGVAKNFGLFVGVQIQVGPACPNWLKTIAGTYTTNGGANTYPKYLNSTYKADYFRFLDTIAAHLNVVGDITEWQVTTGKTGDREPANGDPDPPYNTDPEVPQGEDAAWDTFTRNAWDTAFAAVAGTGIHILLTAGNDHKYTDYVYNRYGPYVWVKEGWLSHGYVFDGQANYALYPNQLSRSEVQGFPLLTPYKEKDGFAVIVSAVALGLGIFNTPTGWYNQGGGSDIRLNSFFNRYANDTIASTSNHAFVQLGLMISIDSTGRWDEPTFGQLILPADEAALAADTNFINANYDTSYARLLKMKRVIHYANPARLTALSTGTGTTAEYDYGGPDGNDHDNDFVFSGVNNFSKFITQTADGHPEYRVGPDTSIYGRFAKSIDSANGYPDMTFTIDPGWAGLTTGYVAITITYFNQGTGSWSFKNGSATLATITNTNTWQWAQTVILAPSFTVADGFSLHYISGRNTIFTLIELQKVVE